MATDGERKERIDDSSSSSDDSSLFGRYWVIPSITAVSVGMTVAGFSYGLRRQTRKLRTEEESKVKEGVKNNLSRRRQQQMEEMSRKTENVTSTRRTRSRVRRTPPPKDLKLNPTRSALKALAYGSVLAWGGALCLTAFTAWYLDVRTWTEFGDVMKFKSRGVAPYLRNVLSLRKDKNSDQQREDSSDVLSQILLEAERKEKKD